MLKFQQNRTKPEVIRIPFVISLDKGRRTDVSVKKIHESWKLNGNIFFELFFGDLDEKWPRQATDESETKKKARQCEIQIIKSLLLDNFSLRSQQMVPNYLLYSYKKPELIKHSGSFITYYLLNAKRFLLIPCVTPNNPIGVLYANYGKFRVLGCIC